jgi:hypothetical protein
MDKQRQDLRTSEEWQKVCKVVRTIEQQAAYYIHEGLTRAGV